MRHLILLLFFCFYKVISSCGLNVTDVVVDNKFPVSTLTEKGAWCWFADPRALHYENENGSINSTYIGYIDVHGYIKATQIDHLHNKTNEVMIRSWFQPDDHNNPTFLVLPDERIMIFYSRHTDEACFYYRVSREPGDITTLGNEIRLETRNNTTYPSPFILTDDPEHIYLCWRGIGWHPTIARISLPDAEDNVKFDWGPYQIVRSMNGRGGVRPYAKYASNGKDKIYLAYTSNHPDNQPENHIYLNYIDIDSKELRDIKGNRLSIIGDTLIHNVDTSPTYSEKHPYAVVENSPHRSWIWELALNGNEDPVIAMVRINEEKTSHDYYHVKWTGERWQTTFLSNAGGHFHQSADIEKCYSAGISIDKQNPQIVYGSVPVDGSMGAVYELKKFTVAHDGSSVSDEQITFNSRKNNIRPFVIDSSSDDVSLVWMQGDYYDWIVSASRPQGFPTAIRTNMTIPRGEVNQKRGLIYSNCDVKISETNRLKIKFPELKVFSIALTLSPDSIDCYGDIIKFAGLTYMIPEGDKAKPFLKDGNKTHVSTNVLGNSDSWLKKERGTNGQWYLPVKPDRFRLIITYEQGLLRTYIDGLIDQSIVMSGLSLSDITVGGVKGVADDLRIYDRVLSQDEIKAMWLE